MTTIVILLGIVVVALYVIGGLYCVFAILATVREAKEIRQACEPDQDQREILKQE